MEPPLTAARPLFLLASVCLFTSPVGERSRASVTGLQAWPPLKRTESM